ncbi:hypothetical protein EG68_06319 [Paragonimus skrjabini miyazakii]|uniref:C2H2-type domain-containing protein n=1 Tax=Paragonimus skrjabini miyazakii TaxID=59628 RepID=A0A8S9YNS2_9TREM|nr:hypothetical protein EG68_06319 [Paragonimus skrjabini miyazakii]
MANLNASHLSCRAIYLFLYFEAGPSRRDVGSEVADEVVTVPTVVETEVSGIAVRECFKWDCGAVFKSNRDLGQHKRHKHPTVLNVERLAVLPRRKGEWSDYDTRKLTNLANAMAVSVSSNAVLYQKLAGMSKGRMAEEVKKRLIKANWQGIAKHDVKDRFETKEALQWSSDENTIIYISNDYGNTTLIDSEQHEEEQWRASMIHTIITSLTKAKESIMKSVELFKIAHVMKFVRISDESARAKLETPVAE